MNGSVAELLSRFDSCHDDLLESLAEITDEELDSPSIYWEDEPVDVRFRLQRFRWHLRSHIMKAREDSDRAEEPHCIQEGRDSQRRLLIAERKILQDHSLLIPKDIPSFLF